MLRRTEMPRRRRSLARSPIRKHSRKPSETRRIYGPPARRAWVKSLPCIVCGHVPSENAHTENGGMGRKADYDTIAPMCRTHHRAFDEHRDPFETEAMREWAQLRARMTDDAWRQRGEA